MGVFLTSCGGGGGDSSQTSPATVRPKSLDGLSIILNNGMRLSFLKSTGAPSAATTGSTENGAVSYNLQGTNAQNSTNLDGAMSGYLAPNSIPNLSYAYTATNERGGTIIITAGGPPTFTAPLTGTFNNILTMPPSLWLSDSAANATAQVFIDITFSDDGSFITDVTTTFGPVGSVSPGNDTSVTSASITLTTGGAVPVNFDVIPDTTSKSVKIPSNLNGFVIVLNDTVNENRLQFVSSGVVTLSDDIGNAVQTIDVNPANVGLNYVYDRQIGADIADLDISNGNPAFEGSYVLTFNAPFDFNLGVGEGIFTADNGLAGTFRLIR